MDSDGDLVLWKVGEVMTVTYEQRTDVLYLLLDDTAQQVRSQELPGNMIIDLGPDDRIVGIEILDASKRTRLDQVLPIEYRQPA